MSADSFNVENERNNVDRINAAAEADHSLQFEPNPITGVIDMINRYKGYGASDNLKHDFTDVFDKDPNLAITQWNQIKKNINEGDLHLPALEFINSTVAHFESEQRTAGKK